MIAVVLDTNIVVSAPIAPKGNEAVVLSLALQGQLALCISPAMLAEYQEVLYRPRLKLQPNETEAVLVNIRGVSRMVHPSETLEISGHGPDNRIYECADAAQADYIVTGNAKHFPKPHKNTMIVNARQLLGLLVS
jgi:putative PIN family toxin of toxin-antitoxin system